MMVGEIVAGMAFGSMALLADGFHMATHAGALAIAALAYLLARRYVHHARFSFGSGKFGDLAGFTNALILGGVALLIGIESLARLRSPISIQFDEAILVAVLGLVVNLVSAWLLNDGGQDGHAHANDHHDGHHHVHQDHNLRAAYFHVLTDALTSVLAIVGLLAGRYYGWVWMDPVVGIVGSIVIAWWSWGLLRGAGMVLLDATPDRALPAQVSELLEQDGDRVLDMHLWQVGPGHVAAIISLVSEFPQTPDVYKAKLKDMKQLSHVTIEINSCADKH
jgi:cation diffusion facilitator family transporter